MHGLLGNHSASVSSDAATYHYIRWSWEHMVFMPYIYLQLHYFSMNQNLYITEDPFHLYISYTDNTLSYNYNKVNLSYVGQKSSFLLQFHFISIVQDSDMRIYTQLFFFS